MGFGVKPSKFIFGLFGLSGLFHLFGLVRLSKNGKGDGRLSQNTSQNQPFLTLNPTIYHHALNKALILQIIYRLYTEQISKNICLINANGSNLPYYI